jgi:hypothetical protein
MTIKITPEEFQEKHNRRLKAALEDMRKGVEKVTEAPTKQAAAKQDKMKAHLIARIDDGTWKKRLEAVSLDEWKDKMINKGIARVSGGIDEAKENVIEFASQLLPHVSAAIDKIKGMPDLTLEDSIARMTAFIREMAKFKKK